MENATQVTLERPTQLLTLDFPIRGPDDQLIRVIWKEEPGKNFGESSSDSVEVIAPDAEKIFGSTGLRKVLTQRRWTFGNEGPSGASTRAFTRSMSNSEATDLTVAIRKAWSQELAIAAVAAAKRKASGE